MISVRMEPSHRSDNDDVCLEVCSEGDVPKGPHVREARRHLGGGRELSSCAHQLPLHESALTLLDAHLESALAYLLS